jgi:hypothetical protein
LSERKVVKMDNGPDETPSDLQAETRKLQRISNLLIVLMVCFIVAAVTLLSIGVPKTAKATCPDEKSEGVTMVVLGSIAAALAATLTVANASARKIIKMNPPY